jgi:hypothetical protein
MLLPRTAALYNRTIHEQCWQGLDNRRHTQVVTSLRGDATVVLLWYALRF